MEIKRYTAAEKKTWELFISESLNGNFLCYRNYLDYHADRFTDHSLLVFNANKLVAVLPANEDGSMLSSHQGLTYGGWVVAKRFSAEEFAQLFLALETYAVQNKFKSIVYKQKPSIFANHFCEADAWVMWNSGWQLTRRDLSFGIDIQNQPGFARDKRYRFNKSTRNGLRIDWDADINVFMQLVNENLQSRFAVKAVHTPQEVALLQSRFPKNISTIAIYQGNTFLGGTWLFEDAQFIHTQYLHTNNTGKELCAVEFLVHSLLEKYKSNKRWLSFGTSTEEAGKVLNTGLASFKEGFGAAGFVHDFYTKML